MSKKTKTTGAIPTTGKICSKPYRCQECGCQKKIETNHWGECYSWGGHNVCPQCPPYKHPTVWVCEEEPPKGVGLPPKWKKVKLSDVVQILGH